LSHFLFRCHGLSLNAADYPDTYRAYLDNTTVGRFLSRARIPDNGGMPDVRAIDVHKALADDTRFRLYRYIGLAGRPVSVREMSRRLSLHPNTLRPHLRRLEEAGLVSREIRKSATVGRPQTLYSIRQTEGEEGRDYRLLAEMLCGLVGGQRQLERARDLAAQWGSYLV